VFLLAFLYTENKKLLFHEESHQISRVCSRVRQNYSYIPLIASDRRSTLYEIKQIAMK